MAASNNKLSKLKNRKISQASNKQESNQTKRTRTSIPRNKSGEFREYTLMTVDEPYYTCLGNSDGIETIPKNDNSNIEIPSWRIKRYPAWSGSGEPEDMSDLKFEKIHNKLEILEKQEKKRKMRRIKELERVKRLKEGRNKQKSYDNSKKELTTLMPSPSNIKAIEITDKIPVSAFGCNLYIEKNPKKSKYFRSKFSYDGCELPK